MSKILDISEAITLVLGISLMDIESILSICIMAVSLIVGVINLVFKIINASKDGKITDEEKKGILEELEKMKEDIEENK